MMPESNVAYALGQYAAIAQVANMHNRISDLMDMGAWEDVETVSAEAIAILERIQSHRVRYLLLTAIVSERDTARRLRDSRGDMPTCRSCGAKYNPWRESAGNGRCADCHN